ncbi:MAG: hypothetical protein AAF614_40300 [Chloroflexota bacterium]
MIRLLSKAWGLVNRYRQLWLAVWLLNFLLAFGLALLPALNLVDASRWTAIRDVADGFDGWLFLEAFGPALGAQVGLGDGEATLSDSVTAVLQQATTLLILIPVLAWVSHAWLKGGILFVYQQAPAEFQWRPFFRACWRWFFPFLLAGFLQASVTLVMIALILATMGPLAGAAGSWVWWGAVPFVAIGFLLWLAVGELTAVYAVAQNTHNIFRTFFQAFGFVATHLLTIFSLYIPTILVLLAVHALFRYGIHPELPRLWWPLVLLVQQLFIISRLVLRLWRFAAGVNVVEIAVRSPEVGSSPVEIMSPVTK